MAFYFLSFLHVQQLLLSELWGRFSSSEHELGGQTSWPRSWLCDLGRSLHFCKMKVLTARTS